MPTTKTCPISRTWIEVVQFHAPASENKETENNKQSQQNSLGKEGLKAIAGPGKNHNKEKQNNRDTNHMLEFLSKWITVLHWTNYFFAKIGQIRFKLELN
ncbi:hypothetical protein Ddye_005394 [Dipteronia dyeriana]|uniref:Uncharacterized protein n=1 Tax=Dipteronia dyeriana TaxID=168575 RepID=A0AAD9XG01_9ROSI|nr:hypothetical protein Ddye_005394 [Dipteronia dyeriana]